METGNRKVEGEQWCVNGDWSVVSVVMACQSRPGRCWRE